MTTPVSEAAGIPVNDAVPYTSYRPISFDLPGRPVPLELKVSAPATGNDLPVILLSHGHGTATFLSSFHGYGPLADFWAAHGFAVIQPTHPDSGMLGLREADDPDAPLYTQWRAKDMHFILDHLDDIEAHADGLAGRLDRDRIAIAGHSLGGHTSCLLLGMKGKDPHDDSVTDMSDDRIKAGVVIAAPGNGDDLASGASQNYPALGYTDFSSMTTPALVIAGDKDYNEFFSDRMTYRSDAYTLSPGPKSLLTVFNGEHILGGISGYDTKEATDDNPERVALVRALAWAYLRSTFYPDDRAWPAAVAALESRTDPLGKVEHK